MDMDVENYSIHDLLTLFSLSDDASDFEINNVANKMIDKMTKEGKPTVALFIRNARDKLLEHISQTDTLAQAEQAQAQAQAGQAQAGQAQAGQAQAGQAQGQTQAGQAQQPDQSKLLDDWWKNEYPKQSDPVQNARITDRKQKVQFFGPEHQQMNREQLGVSQSYNVPVAQGTINPNLQNLTSRIICIDSQYRQNILPYVNNPNVPSYNTDYTLDLSDPLTNATSLKLYSVQIPTTWYAFDHSLGNTCFEYNTGFGSIPTIIDISDGNYTILQFIDQLNTVSAAYDLSFAYLPATFQISIQNTSGSNATLIFYSGSGLCKQACGPGAKINQNLGWNLGFRIPPDSNGIISIVIPPGQTVISDVPADTYGPKYFILVVDDYNNNHLNNGLVNIVDTTTKLSIPTYYNAKDVSCNDTFNQSQSFMVRTAPRTLTQAQLYTVNEIVANRKQTINRTSGPTTTDVLAIIPVQLVNTFRPGPYVQFGQALQANVRTYFGPVNIDRLRVRLVDDKGNLVNLHDNDWSFTMVVEELYQY